MKLTFCGAAKQVTGSCYFLETSDSRILIDCGLVQGSRIAEEQNLEPFPFDPATLDVVVLTHAHLDHCGRIPKLVREGFTGRIIATGPTARLAQLIIEDSADIIAHEARRHNHEPVYTIEDVIKAKTLFEEVEYRKPIQIKENTQVEFFDAGHILGSSMIQITNAGKSIVFSGDLGNPPVPILKDTDVIGNADYIVMESTYGGRVHEDKKTRTLLLRSAIYETAIMKGVLMIPAFSIERTQELLYELNELVNNKDIPPVPIFLDSPLAIKATEVFKDFESYFDTAATNIIKSGDDLFNFPGLRSTLKAEDSKQIAKYPGPKVVIAGSGMANGGRIVHHIEQNIGFFANQYLIVGYQVQGSLGRRLLDGEKTVRIHGKEYEVKAKIRAIGGYSAHADQPRLVKWVGEFDQQQLKKIFITHGEEEQSEELKAKLHETYNKECHVPSVKEVVEL